MCKVGVFLLGESTMKTRWGAKRASALSTFALVLLFVAAFIVSTNILFAQATDAIITGTITDATGAVVPNATVEAENTATGVKYTTRTDANGFYRFNNVPVGTYNVTASATGFGTVKLARVEAVLNRTVTANMTLQVGPVAQTVEVTEAAAAVDTATAQLQSTYTTKEVADLPISAMALGPLNVSLLNAGVASSGGTGLGEGPSVGGQRPRNNSFNVEGVDNNRKDVTGSNLRIPNEATQEVTVLLNQFSAEFGHAGGGVFNTIIRGGTNEIHGRLFHYLQNRKLNAVDEANKRQGQRENTRYDDNRFGGNVGGPLIRNKLFWFGHFEYNPFGSATPPASAKYAPTAQGYDMLSRISGLSQTNLNFLKQWVPAAPAPSGDTTPVLGTAIPLGILPVNYPQYQNTRTWLVSVDYNIADNNQLRSRYADQRSSGFSLETTPDLPAFNQPRTTTSKLFTLTDVHTFNPTVTNELRLGYNRYNDTIPAGDFEFPGLDMFPNIQLVDDLAMSIGPLGTAPQSGIINTYQIIDNLTWTAGRHTWKFGGEGRKYIAPTNFIQRVRGDYLYSNIERFLRDLNPDVEASRNLGGVPFSGNSIAAYFFVNDNWRVRQNLSLNLGLRYEYKGIAEGDKLQVLNAASSIPGLIEFKEPEPSMLNFAPRIGIAYSPGQDGRTSIRAGFSMAYDNYPDNFGTLSKPPQLESTITLDTNVTTQNFLRSGGISPSLRPDQLTRADAIAATSAWTQDQRLPYSLSWSVGVQRGFMNDYTAEVRYVGTRGVRLFTQHRVNVIEPINANNSLPTFLQRPSQAELDRLPVTLDDLLRLPRYRSDFAAGGFNQQPIFTVDPRGNSVYHGLQTELTKRYSSGFLYKAAYTWSKTIDDSTADLFSTILSPRRPQSFQDMRSERSRSFLDRTHRFTFSWVYDARWFAGSNWFAKNLIGNWNISGVYIYESPQYVTVQSAVDSNLNGDAAGDRAVVNPAGTASRGSAVTALTNSAGRTVGYLANDPSARYIVAGRGVHPNAGRQTIPTEPINNWDLALRKQFNFTERMFFQIGAVAANVFNHAQYVPGSVNSIQSVDSGAVDRRFVIPGSPIFYDPTQTFSSSPRSIQIVGRFVF